MSSNGQLDFLFIGHVKGVGMRKVCAEFKLAHSKNLYRGIEFQLPAYMNSHGTDNGAYCIIVFRGEEFTRPKEHDLTINNRLALSSERGWPSINNPIKIHRLKIAKPESASKI